MHASPPVDWIKAPGATAELVPETMFAGRVALYRAGPPGATESVVLVHGWAGRRARLDARDPGARAALRGVRGGPSGFGYSDKGNTTTHRTTWRALDTVLTPRIAGRFTLIGHSMGGTVALAYAATYPSRVRAPGAGRRRRRAASVGVRRVPRPRRRTARPGPGFAVVRVGGARNPAARRELAGARRSRARARRQRMLRGDPSAIAAFAMVEHDFSARCARSSRPR